MTELVDRHANWMVPRTSKVATRSILRAATAVAGLVLLSFPAGAQPTLPETATATCDYSAAGKCYVVQSTVLTTSSPDADHFHVCRSVDITDPNGWGGCDSVIRDSHGAPLEVGPSFLVEGGDLPPHPLRRAYRFRACDANDVCTGWNAATYVSRDTAPPYAPGPTFVNGCVFLPGVTSECWVQGDFDVRTTPPLDDGGSGVKANGYWVCHSVDVTGWGGCDVTLSMSTFSSAHIQGNHRPGLGYRKAYYFRAKDNAGNKWSPWNTKLYVRRDANNPTVSASNADPETWYTSRTATVSAGDSVGGAGVNSGLKAVRFRWDDPLPADCESGSPTSDGAVLPVATGDKTLYLCARDWSGRVTHWNGRYRVAAHSLGVQPVEALGITFGDNSGYDPSVMLDASGTQGTAFVQKPEDYEGHYHDTIVEYLLSGLKVGRVTKGHAGWGCLPPQTGDPKNPSAGPDALANPYAPGQRLVFYSRGNKDGFRGRAWLSYEGSGWTATDKALLHPLCNETLCNESVPGCNQKCENQMGVARVAAREVGGYYYLYLEVRINVGYPTNVVGVFLMRIEKKSTPPYVEFGAGKAQLYRSRNKTWHDLAYDADEGYYVDFCNLAGGAATWQILDTLTQLGNVERTPWGEYILTYKKDAYVKYRISSSPEFDSASLLVSEGIMDLSGVDILRPNGPLYPNLYRKPGTAEYILFFTDQTIRGNEASSRIESARVLPATATP